MSAGYTLIFLAFFPLFILFVRLLKRFFIEMYTRVKVRLYLSFIAFISVLAFRLAAYYIIQFSSLPWLTVETVRGETPLYISEIFIALCYMKIMVSKYRKQVDKNRDEEAIKDFDPEFLTNSQSMQSNLSMPNVVEFDNNTPLLNTAERAMMEHR